MKFILSIVTAIFHEHKKYMNIQCKNKRKMVIKKTKIFKIR